MKRLIVLIVLLVTVTVAYAFEPDAWVTASAQKDADASISTSTGYLYSIMIDQSGVTTALRFDIYDSGATIYGTQIVPSFMVGSGVSAPLLINFDTPVGFNDGLYVDVTSTQVVPKYIIYYRER